MKKKTKKKINGVVDKAITQALQESSPGCKAIITPEGVMVVDKNGFLI